MLTTRSIWLSLVAACTLSCFLANGGHEAVATVVSIHGHTATAALHGTMLQTSGAAALQNPARPSV